MKNIGNYYIYNKSTGVQVPILPPEIESHNQSANYSTTTPIGATSSVVTYRNTELQKISFNFTIHEDLLIHITNGRYGQVKNVNRNISNLDIYKDVLDSLVFPRHNGQVLESPNIYLKLGGSRVLNGVIPSISFTKKGPIRNGYKTVLEVGIEFLEVRSFNVGSTDIVQGNY